MIHPLNALLRHGVRWKWMQECAVAFTHAKESLSAESVLAHYNPQLPLRLAGDASCYGIGAVLSHQYPDGTERLIAYASQTLQPSEKNYTQIEREALSLVFGIQNFHQYIYGQKFTLITNHRPLTTIFGDKKGIPPITAARMQRWGVLLSAYHYNIEFKLTTSHANADGLSRLPVTDTAAVGNPKDVTLFNVSQIASLPVTEVHIQGATRKDKFLGAVLRYTQQGWPDQVPEHLKPYWLRRNKFSVERGVLLWGIRVVIPTNLKEQVLQEIHQGHLGINKMKQIARSYVWWPKIDADLEAVSKSCKACQEVWNSLQLPCFTPGFGPQNCEYAYKSILLDHF